MIQVQGNQMNNVSITRQQRYNRFTKAAIEYQKKKDIHRTALCLYILQSEKLYLEGDYKSVFDLGVDILKVSKGTVSGYVNVAKKFLDTNTGKSIFASDKGDFTYLQLLEMKKLKTEEAKELVNSGIVNYGSTAQEIKSAVASYLGQIQAEKDKLKEDSIKPIKTAYEAFNASYNELYEMVSGDDACKELLQKIMDSVVVLYNENDRLWN